MMYHSDPETWTVKGKKKNDFTDVPSTPVIDFEPTTSDTERVIQIIKTGIQNITDWGHPPLRGLCLAVGGYVAAGYIDVFQARDLIFNLIDNHNYLRQKSRTYKQTVIWALDAGKSKPIYL
jgi:hypothetical protein